MYMSPAYDGGERISMEGMILNLCEGVYYLGPGAESPIITSIGACTRREKRLYRCGVAHLVLSPPPASMPGLLCLLFLET